MEKVKEKDNRKAGFWEVFIFILKVTIIGFGGGNALMPVIQREAVGKKKWLSEEEFDDIVIVTNMLPGASVIQTLSYIAVSLLGKVKGTILTLLAIIPHVLLAFTFLVVLTKYFPPEYLKIISVGVLVAIIAFLINFGVRYAKQAHKTMSTPLWILIFLFSAGYSLFIPAPYNLPVVAIVVVIAIYSFWYLLTKKKKAKLSQKQKEEEQVKICEIGKEELIESNLETNMQCTIKHNTYNNINLEDKWWHLL
ncbi:chromate transporter [Mycoplasmopsis verecunda]|uniref:Chromate transporter n=1 Tax=Mycoplasmopsis verecunda TaxID=171291 RepID=A0A1T4L7W8_9BACT|nr:chromate transporter [Mycoplasmopsis verecunda]WPB54767.1 chromate transporter [Mycoplasmopsis verecunda]SJZ50611.1 chromate transporter [Mycoplasmopsis verecunda]